jgi:hypothetical protein
MNLSIIMSVIEFENYINSLKLSSLGFKDLVPNNSTKATTPEPDATNSTADDTAGATGGRRLNSYLDENNTEHAHDLKFGFHYVKGEQTNDLWLKLDFQEFGYVNIGERMDSIDVQIKNTSFIVSVATLKPLSNETLEKEFSMNVPLLEPADENTYAQFLIFLEFLKYF